jgi:hypothetical protein
LRGFDVDELLMLSGRIVERVKGVLECYFGLELEEPGVPLHEPITRFYSEEAGELVRLGTTVVEGVGSIDNSPPERVPHEEYVGKDLAKARLLMPLQLKRLENKVEGLSIQVHMLVGVMRKAFQRSVYEVDSSQREEKEQRYIS